MPAPRWVRRAGPWRSPAGWPGPRCQPRFRPAATGRRNSENDPARKQREDPLPDEVGDPVAQDAQQERLLQDQAEDDAVARPHQLEHGDVVELVERQGVEDQGHDDGRDDDEQDAEQAQLPAGAVHDAAHQQLPLALEV